MPAGRPWAGRAALLLSIGLLMPPFQPGDRVRCVVSTAEDMRGLELLGTVGTVERCAWFEGALDGAWVAGWDVRVVWDGVLPRMLAHHDPEELEPAGE